MEAREREAVVMPAMGRRSEKRRTTTERDKRRFRRDLGVESVDRLSLCGDEEEEWDVDIRGLKPALMSYTIACDRTSEHAKRINSQSLD